MIWRVIDLKKSVPLHNSFLEFFKMIIEFFSNSIYYSYVLINLTSVWQRLNNFLKFTNHWCTKLKAIQKWILIQKSHEIAGAKVKRYFKKDINPLQTIKHSYMWNLNLNCGAQCCKTTCFQFSFCVLVRKQRQWGENNFCFYNCTLILPSIVGQLMYVFAVVVLWKNMHMSLLGCFSYSTIDTKANSIWSVVLKGI